MQSNSDTESTTPALEILIPGISRIICDNYGDGDLAGYETGSLQHLYDAARSDNFSDSLFLFVVAELVESDPEDAEQAMTVLDRAAQDILNVRNAIAGRCGIHEVEMVDIDDPDLSALRIIRRAIQPERLVTRDEVCPALLDLTLGHRTLAVERALELIELRDAQVVRG